MSTASMNSEQEDMTFIPDERDYEAAKMDPAFARASDANKYRLAFVA